MRVKVSFLLAPVELVYPRKPARAGGTLVRVMRPRIAAQSCAWLHSRSPLRLRVPAPADVQRRFAESKSLCDAAPSIKVLLSLAETVDTVTPVYSERRSPPRPCRPVVSGPMEPIVAQCYAYLHNIEHDLDDLTQEDREACESKTARLWQTEAVRSGRAIGPSVSGQHFASLRCAEQAPQQPHL